MFKLVMDCPGVVLARLLGVGDEPHAVKLLRKMLIVMAYSELYDACWYALHHPTIRHNGTGLAQTPFGALVRHVRTGCGYGPVDLRRMSLRP